MPRGGVEKTENEKQRNRNADKGTFIFYFLFLGEKNLVYRDRTHVPTCQKDTRLPLSYRGDRLIILKEEVVIVVLTCMVRGFLLQFFSNRQKSVALVKSKHKHWPRCLY